jgi:hypothetical protein
MRGPWPDGSACQVRQGCSSKSARINSCIGQIIKQQNIEFLEHTDKDAGKSIEISTGDAILRITRVLVYYDELGLPRTNVMHVYAQWASWHHPNDESKRLPLHDGRHFHDMDLAWQISAGNRMLETILNADIQVD